MKFPYDSVRPPQEELIALVKRALTSRKHAVIEAPTGTGKTVAVLYPVLEYALKRNLKVLYLTRTKTQQDRVLSEMKRFPGIPAIGIRGRNELCPVISSSDELLSGTPEELSRLCGRMKPECAYYRKLNDINTNEFLSWLHTSAHTVGDLHSRLMSEGVCSYEVIKRFMSDTVLVTVPYIYFFSPHIQSHLLRWMGVELEELVVVVDEAHNLPDFARELRSFDISERSLDMVAAEVREFEIDRDIPNIMDFLEYVREVMYRLAENVNDDAVVPSESFKMHLHMLSGMNFPDILNLARDMVTFGDIVKEKKLEMKKLPRSYLHRFGAFISLWMETMDDDLVRLVIRDNGVRLQMYSLDPSPVTSILNNTFISVHISGTLRPLDDYVRQVSLPDDTLTSVVTYDIYLRRRAVFYVSGVSTRYADRSTDVMDRLSAYLHDIIRLKKRTIVFFPSYSIMRDFLSAHFSGEAVLDDPNISTAELMNKMKSFFVDSVPVFTVIGGRISEGMDFPDNTLDVVVIVGIPYPRPTAQNHALINYYDVKLGDGYGWEIAVAAPTARKLLQTIGRLIRSEDDCGVAVILDERAVHFKKEIDMKFTEAPAEDIKKFLKNCE